MRLENRTGTILQILATYKNGEKVDTLLGANESAYYGDLKKGESLKIISQENGTATITMSEDEIFWEVSSKENDDVVKACGNTDNFLHLQDITVGNWWERHLNGISIQVTYQ